MNVVEQLKTTGRVQRGQIGVQVQEITTENARGFGLPDTRGALVADVVPGSPAEKAGIERGDVIREINGRQINQASDLPPIVGAMAPGSRAELTVWREGRAREIDVTLSQLDESVAGAAGATPGARPPSAAKSSNPLGLVGQELTAEQRRQFGLEAGEGVGIARVEGLAARTAGIQPGDVILSVGRIEVGTPAELDRELRNVKAGQTVMLLVRSRSGGTQFVAVTPRVDGE
jgi:serine protease Do